MQLSVVDEKWVRYMKICFVHAGLKSHGGIGRVVSVVANKLSSEQFDVHVVSFYDVPDTPDVYEMKRDIEKHALFAAPISMKKAMLKGGVGKLANYVKENGIEVVIACGALYFPLVVMAAWRAGCASVCWEHTNPQIKSDHSFQGFARCFGMAFSSANVLITNAAKIFYDKKIRAAKNVLIYNPVDDELFNQPSVYDVDSKRIISVGRLSYPKNYSLLIEIAADVFRKHPDWQWHIYGEGEERIIIEEKIRQYSMNNNVFLKGAVSDIYRYYEKYSFLVMTSRYEGFPMVLIEAAARGLPIVAFDIPTGPREIIDHGHNGLLVPANQKDEMIRSIETLMDDPASRQRYSSNAINSVLRFSNAKIIEQWKHLLTNIRK